VGEDIELYYENVFKAQWEKLDKNWREILMTVLRAVYTWVFESARH